jgi:Na+-transporting NADH:ubiquinone oxidoreductase subunit B
MKFLRKKLDELKPNFQKGGKLHFLHSTFDAMETFMFVPDHVTEKGTHIKDGIDLKRTMFFVILALIPATLFGMWNVGFQHFRAYGEEVTFIQQFLFGFLQVLPIIVVSYVVGLGIEFAFCQMNGHPVNEGFLVSGLLIPLVLPPDIPLWMVALGTAFAVILGKEVFGGTGMNILNPALTARVFLYFAYPGAMSGDEVWAVANFKEQLADGFSGATNLGLAAVGKPMAYSAWDSFIGIIPGSIGETSVVMILIGAAFLILTGIGSWKIMTSVFVGGYGMAGILYLAGYGSGSSYLMMEPHMHLLIGGFAFGAVFMATDPVSAAQTNRGKWIYGMLIGVLTILIRVFNPAFPEGIMMAILLMNVFAPLIDYFVVQSNIKRRLSRVKA